MLTPQMDYDVRKSLAALQQAVNAVNESRVATPGKLRELEEYVCLKSRALYSRYVDAMLWRGSIDKPTHDLVADALVAAVNCLPLTIKDSEGKEQAYPVRISVAARYDDFNSFSAHLLEQASESSQTENSVAFL